ncbi:hypothetical protein F4775DRAFT_128219 [Biscogniauxia sp. FL1348]|nr:hypothetical protein F4775DRAFT_128219 [Biscogniauxia sp. FL1348]
MDDPANPPIPPNRPMSETPRRSRKAAGKARQTGELQIPDAQMQGAAPHLPYEGARDEEMENAFLMATPQHKIASAPFIEASGSSRPMTRSMTRVHFDAILTTTPGTRTRLQDRLLNSSAKATVGDSTSILEDSRDVVYAGEVHDVGADLDEDVDLDVDLDVGLDENEDEDNDAMEDEDGDGGDSYDNDEAEEEDSEMADDVLHNPRAPSRGGRATRRHPEVGQLRMPRRSARIGARKATTRDSTPSAALSTLPKDSERIRRRQKKEQIRKGNKAAPVRRSPRLAKPLAEFQKYPQLPNEIKIMIWEAAINPRLMYICNRSSLLHASAQFGVQNKRPTWFMTCRLSVWVAKRHYRKMFALHNPMLPQLDFTLMQDVNPHLDIIIFEPCHGGCRGYYCASHQYHEADRSAVRYLAVQIDSPNLDPSADAGWITISKSWPNVETLYFMKPAIKGPDMREKALIRVKEGEHEAGLRRRFDDWKKEAGKDKKVLAIEFVKVVEREADTKDVQFRYKNVEDRKTGLPEDIILG